MEYTQPELSGLSKRERKLLAYFHETNEAVVTSEMLVMAFALSKQNANLILLRLQRKGWLQRIKRGHYSLVDISSRSVSPIAENPLALAMRLYSPCYIGGWTAAEYWDLTEQIFNSILVFTSNPQRKTKQHLSGIDFIVHVLKDDHIFGLKNVWSGNQKISFSDPTRTVIDILDKPSSGAGARHSLDVIQNYFESRHQDPEQLVAYAEKIGRGTVFKRLGFVLERYTDNSKLVEHCRESISKGISKFDPGGSDTGVFLKRWNLIINIPIEGIN